MATAGQPFPRSLDTDSKLKGTLQDSLPIGEKCGYFTPLEVVARGGMGTLLKVQLHREDFVAPYIFSHILSGDLSPKMIGISGAYELHDPEFEEEVGRRIAQVDRKGFLYQRMASELETREYQLVKAGYVAAAKIPSRADPQVLSRFLREVRSLHNMGDHPNIVKYISCDRLDDRPALIMEYFPSATLADTAYASRIPTEWALRTFVLILKALHHAHQKGVVHRDVKPANILVSGEEVKITDFGLAKSIGPEATNLTMAEQRVGTPAYMAPEQIDARWGELGEWTDVYQVGLTLFEVLTQKQMYDEREYLARIEALPKGSLKDSDPKKLILEEVADPGRTHPHFPRDFDPSLPDEVEKLVMTLCQKDILERYTCELALEHAEELLRHRVFSHAEPTRPASEETQRESRTTLILAASEALLAKRAYREAEAFRRCSAILAAAEADADLIARADHLEEARRAIRRLPRPKFPELHVRFESLVRGIEAQKDDIEAFRPNRKISIEIIREFESLMARIEGDYFYEVPPDEIRKRGHAILTRAEQHLERIRRTGLPDRLIGGYLAKLAGVITEVPRLEDHLATRKAEFIRRKRAELDEALKNNPNEAALILLALKRVLLSSEADDLSKALFAEIEKGLGPEFRDQAFQ